VKNLLIRSVITAVLIGFLVGFVDYVRSFRGGVKYEPPIAEDEWRQLRELPMSKAEVVLVSRSKVHTRRQWLLESVGHSFFWMGVADNSIVPILGVFVGCVLVGRLQTRQGNTR
jgi:hypothetical protein